MKTSQPTSRPHNCQVLVSTAMNYPCQNQSGYDGIDKVLLLSVSDPGHPTYFMEQQQRLRLTGNQSRNMRINS